MRVLRFDTSRSISRGLTSNVATVSLNVVVPTPPTANDDAYILPSGGTPFVVPATSGLLTNDGSPGGLPLVAVLYSPPGHGTVALNADGSFGYTANPGTSGSDAFTYEVTAGGMTSNLATVTLTVPAPPIANADAYARPADGSPLAVPASSGVLANDTSISGQPMTASLISWASHGMAMLNPDGSFTYTANPGYVGTDGFTYTATAGGMTSNVATVTVTVAAPTPPAANDDAYSLPANGMPLVVPAASGVLANDTGSAGQVLSAVPGTSPAHGTVALNSDGSFTYTASPGYHGSDNFTYTATASGLSSNVATVTLLVGLVGVPDSYSVHHDTLLQTDSTDGVLANDSNAGGPSPTASLATGPQHGTLGLNPDGSFTYTPTAGYVGADSFTYLASAGGTSTGSVLVSLAVTDAAPNSPNASYTVHAGQTLQVAAPGLAAIGSDPDSQDTLTYAVDAGPAHGQLQLAANGGFTYHASQGFVGTDTFTYHANDGAMNSPTGTVTIQVTDAAPLAGDESYDVAANAVLNDPTKSVLSNTTDPDGDPVTAHLLAGPAHAGQFTLNPNGTFVYAPAANFVGTDTFTFVANDGEEDSAPAAVTFNVSADVVGHDYYYVLPPSGIMDVAPANGVLSNVTNPTMIPIQASLVRQPSAGAVTLGADGSFLYLRDTSAKPPAEATFDVLIVGVGILSPLSFSLEHVHILYKAPKVSLRSEDFVATGKPGDSKVYRITPDKGGPAYETMWTSDEKDKRDPLALVAGSKFDLAVTMRVDPADVGFWRAEAAHAVIGVGSNFLPRGVGSRCMTPTVTFADVTLSVTWKGVGWNFPSASVNDFVDDTFAVGLPNLQTSTPFLGTNYVNIPVDGVAKHQIYVLAGTPLAGVTLFHTVVRVGTLAAQGRVAYTEGDKLQVSTAIVKAFQTPKVMRADNPVVLTYYGKWTVAAKDDAGTRTTAKLLATGDGNCNAWSNFFMDVVQAQGVPLGATASRFIAVNPKARLDPATFPKVGFAKEAPVMLVKNWAVSPNAKGPTLIRAQQLDLGGRGYLFSDKDGKLVPNPNLEVGNSIACQGGTPKPFAYFTDHQAVEIRIAGTEGGNDKTILFDPSYGTEAAGENDQDAAGRLLAWQNQSLDFIGALYIFTPNPDVRALVVQSITNATTKSFVSYFDPLAPKSEPTIMTKFETALIAALIAWTAADAAAPPPARGEALKGVVLGGDVVYCVVGKSAVVYVHVQPLAQDRPGRGSWCAISDVPPPRWHIGHGAFWVSSDSRVGLFNHSRSLGGGRLGRYDLGLLHAKDAMLIGHEGKDGILIGRGGIDFSSNLPADLSPFLAHDRRYFLYYDTLPAGKAEARHFTLTNLTSPFDDRNKEFEQSKTPASKFYCDLGERRRDEDGEWEEKSWKAEWSAPAAFKEPFQAIAHGDDYYFATRSGSLYRAAKPAKGKDRTLARVWDGRRRPVEAFVSDAKTGKTFLFVPPAEDGGKPAFFELSDRPKLVEYDPALVPTPPLDEPHRTVVHAARILVALKKIEGTLPPVGGDEQKP